MSAINQKSISGITSITTPAGVDDVFTVHTNDTTERFRVDSNGNQSISGIVTVSQDLDVDGHTNLDNVNIAGVTTSTGNIYADNYFANSGLTLNNNGNPSINLTSTSTTGSSRINFGDPGSNTVGKIYYVHDGDYMYFSTNYNERLRIHSDGSITHNYGNPNASATFRISKNGSGAAELRFDTATVNTASLYLGDDEQLRIRYGGTEHTRFTSDGKVGIGTDNPNVALEVLNDSPGIRLTDKDSSAGLLSYTQLTNINGNTYVYTRANSNNGNYLIGGIGGGTFDEFIRITSAGRVGIGTNNPSQKLDVNGIIAASQGVRVPHGSATTNYVSVGDNGALRFWATSHSYADIRAGSLHFRNAALENVLEIQQDKDVFFYGNVYFQATRFDQTVTINDTITHHGDTDTKIRFPAADTITAETAGSERLRIDSTGMVKMGTSGAPTDILDVHRDSTTAYDASDDNAQRTHSASITVRNDNGTTNSFSQLVFDTGGSNQSIARIVAIRKGSATNDLAFVTEHNNTKAEKLRIQSNGLVGIGTDNPGALLNVYGTDSRLRLSKSDAAANVKHWDFAAQGERLRLQAKNDAGAGGGNLFDFYRVAEQVNEFRGLNSGNTWFVIDNSGKKVGIGTDDPQDELHIEDASPAIRLTDSANSQYAFIDGNSGNLVLHSDKDNSGSSSTVKFAVDNSVKMTLDHNGHLDLATGNLQFASGSGIDFSNNSDGGRTISTDGNKFDDYEEGDHVTTVTMSGATSNYTDRTLAYTKIGRVVHVTGRIHMTNGAGGTNFAFSLPFTCASGVKFETSNEMQNIRFNDGYTFRISAGVAEARLQSDGANTGIGVGNPHINVNLTYFTS